MPQKSHLWNHFYGNRTHFQNNRTHLNAWCKYCVGVYIRAKQAADREACARGECQFVRTEDELIKDGAKLILTCETVLITFYSSAGSAYLAVKPMVGKVNVLKSHRKRHRLHHSQASRARYNHSQQKMRTLEDQSGGRVALAGTKDSLRVICVIGSSHAGYHGMQQTILKLDSFLQSGFPPMSSFPIVGFLVDAS